MTFAAEPYGVFVDDLVTSLTGGTTRERFEFVPEAAPFRLSASGDVVAATVRVHGLLDGAFHRFVNGADFAVAADGTLAWQAGDDPAVPAAGASWPDPGSRFYASYERRPDPESPPRLTDRNPGSVVRTLAESFAREYAVLSLQLEEVYRAAFLDTASGRDLDQVVALLGMERRTQAIAAGEVVFSRSTPSPGDVTITGGTLVSTGDGPPVTVETTETSILRTGTLSVAVPVRALVEGAGGVAAANTLTVIHRPVLGVEVVTNPEPLAFSGGNETDVSLRARARRALEASGRATPGAIVGALTSVEGIREQDVRIVEDHVAFPGVVKVAVAAELDEGRRRQAAALIEAHRPAGIRVIHDLAVPAPAGPSAGATTGSEDGVNGAPSSRDGIWFPVGVVAVVTPTSATPTAAQKTSLTRAVQAAVEAFVGARGVGETIVYNQLVHSVMAVAGVYDVSVELYPMPPEGEPARTGRRNLPPAPPDTRPRLDELDVTLRGALVALDVTVTVERLGLAATADPATALADVRTDVERRLGELLATLPATIDPPALLGGLSATDTYQVEELSYTAEFVDEGLRILAQNRPITPSADQQPWVRSVFVTEETRTS